MSFRSLRPSHAATKAASPFSASTPKTAPIKRERSCAATRVSFPHFADPGGGVARVFRGGRVFPTTAFYSVDGKLAFTHAGSYPTEAKLDADIRRYAL